MSDSDPYDYGLVANGATSDHSFTVTNAGGVPATGMSGLGLSAPFTFKGGNYPGTGGNCGTSLNAAQNCSVVVTFAPTTSGVTNQSLSVSYVNGVGSTSVTRSVRGTGAQPATISISDGPTYNFGTVAINGSYDKTLTLTNGGAFAATLMAGTGLSAPYTYKGGSYPGTGGNCSTTLAASMACTIVVNLSPTTLGTLSATANVSYNNGVTTVAATRDLTASSVAAATMTISDGATYDFGTRATGSSIDKTFTVSNTGGVNATAASIAPLSAPYTFKGGSYPGAGGTCGTSLNASQNCTLVVTFAPTSTGLQTSALTFTFNDGATAAQTSNRPIQGTGASPATLTISDSSPYNYGSVANGGVSEHPFTIANTGGVSASAMAITGVSAPFTFKGGSFPGTGGTCTTTLSASLNCTVIVVFAPTVAGVQNATLSLGYNDGVQAQSTTRTVTGTGVNPANLVLSDATLYDYGPVVATASADHAFTVTNTGDLAASSLTATGLSAPFAFKGGSFPGTGGSCGSTLNAGLNCTIVVTFNPTATGSFSGTLTANYYDGAQNRTSPRNIQGTGATAASLTISDATTYNFGTVARGASVNKTFTITNGGGVGATALVGAALSAPYSFAGGSYPGGGTCATSLSAGASCTVVVNYNPTTVATANATLAVGYNDGLAAQNATRPVTGTAVAPALITVTDVTTNNFGTVAVGGSADLTFTVANTGSFTATTVTGTGLAAPFTFKGGGAFPGSGGTCTATLNAGANCTVVVTYAPSATGAQSATFNTTYFDGAFAQSTGHGVMGTGASPASLAISDVDPYDFGTMANGSSTDKTFTITNSGGVPATGINGAGLGAPFSFKGGGFPGSGGSCTATLGASLNCTVVVTFAPTATGTTTSSFSLAYATGAGNSSSAKGVKGTGAAPATLTISDGPTYNFGTVATTGFKDYTLTVSNTGAFAATGISASALSAPYAYKGGSYPGTGGSCSTTLSPSLTCTVIVTFAPTANGAANATTTLTYNNGATTTNVARNLTGTGAAAATMTISDATTYDFGTKATGSSTDKTFTVTNSGGVDATGASVAALSAPYTFKGGPYPGSGGSCGSTLTASNSCTVVVTFAPTSTGLQSTSLAFTFNDGVTATQTSTRPIQGTGASPANITISDSSPYNYGSVANGGFADHTFTIANTGGVPATSLAITGLAAPYTFKNGTFPGTGGSCTSTLNATMNCTVVVTFAPTVAGIQNATLNVGYNDGVQAQSSVRTLTGTGVTPAVLAISDTSPYDYGAVVQSGTSDHTFTITNTGNLAASSIGITGLSGAFGYKGGSYPGSGGSCGTTLNASISCTVVITFAPSATGSFSSSMVVGYFDGAQTQSTTRTMQGTGATAASLTISDASTYTFGTVANGASIDKVFTVTNGGGVPATALNGSGLSAPLSLKGGGFPGSGGSCGSSLPAGQSCTVVVNYNPSSSATTSQTLSVGYNTGLGASSATRPITGTSVAPASITVTDATTNDFGTVAVGGFAERTFTLTNNGAFAASGIAGGTLSAPYAYKGGPFPGTGGTCTTTLNASAACTVVVRFSPTATGTQGLTMSVAYNDGAQAQTATRPFTGVGAAPATLSFSASGTYDYGTKVNNTSTDQTFTITNGGGVPATGINGSGLSSPFLFKGGSYPGTGGTCSTTLSASLSCTVVVTFAPTTSNTYSSTLTVAYTDGVQAQSITKAYTGTSVAPATLTLSGTAPTDFGPVATGGSNTVTLTLTNGGGITASSLNATGLAAPFTFKGTGGYPGQGGNCGATLAPGPGCTIVLTFAPTSTGSQTATLNLAYNDGANPQGLSRGLQGVGSTPASLSISGTSPYDFGTVAQNSSTDATLTLQNNGGAPALTIGGSGLSAPYTFKGGSFPGTGGTCTTTLNPSQSCTFVINYTPTATGATTGTLSIGYNDGVNPQTVAYGTKGTAVSAANLTISDTSPYNYGTLATGASADKTFTISNTGGFSASTIGITGLGAPFTFKGGAGFPGTGGSCTTSLAASANCTVVVTYAPTATGTQTASVIVGYYDGATTQSTTRTLTGSAAGPAVLSISDGPTYDYGTVANTTSVDRTFTVSNTGGVSATGLAGGGISAPFTFKGGTFPGSGGSCTTTLNSGLNCTIIVTYAPTGTATTNQTISIDYNDGAAAQSSTRAVRGTAANPASLAFTETSFNYGAVAQGAAVDHTFTVTNTGGLPGTSLVIGSALSAPFQFKGGAYPGTGGSCANSLNASLSCTVVVTFTPTSSSGSPSLTMTASYNNGATTANFSSNLSGTNSTAALLTVNGGATYDFGTVANTSSNDKTLTVANSGGVAAVSMSGAGLSAPYGFKGGGYPGTGGTCGASLNGGNTCTIVVNFSPTTVGANQNATITISYNSTVANTTATSGLTGTAVAPATLTISDGATFAFGSVYIGQTADKTFTVSNSGAFSGSSITGGSPAPFAFKGGGGYPGTGGTCGTTLAGPGSCTIVITYTPTAAGSNSGTVTVSYNNGASTQSTTRAMTGTAVPPDPPSAPGTPTLSLTAFSQLTVNWTASTSGTPSITYSVMRATSSGGTYTAVASGLSTLTYTDTGVTAGTPYYYKIRATTLGGTADSATYSVGTPLGTYDIASAQAADRSVVLTWGASAGASTYTVRYGTATGSYPSVASSAATSPWTIGGLTPGVPYYFQVVAVNAVGSMPNVTEFSATPIAVPITLTKGSRPDALCGILSNNSLRCWGRAFYGMLGDGSTLQLGDNTEDLGDGNSPVLMGAGRTITSFYGSHYGQHMCAILDNGALKCWGRNANGQLGQGDVINRGGLPATIGDNLPAINLGTGRTAAKVAVGEAFTCAILDNGTVKCWGYNQYGQLGQGNVVQRGAVVNQMGDFLTPTNLGTGRTAVAISAGRSHACAILDTGAVKCWGYNTVGQLGYDNTTNYGSAGSQMGDSLATVNLGSGRTATAISLGDYFSCALLDNATVKCWGYGLSGRLGSGATANIGAASGDMAALAAIALPTGRTVTKLAAGGDHTCVIMDNATITCWGTNNHGQLGIESNAGGKANIGDASGEMGTAMIVANMGTGRTATKISAGLQTTCATLDNNTAKCWGYNASGQLGIGNPLDPDVGSASGSMGDPLVPILPGTSRTVSSAQSFRDNVCFIRDDAVGICYGDNNYGRLALGAPANAGDDPNEMGQYLNVTDLGTGNSVSKVTMGYAHTCAILTTGKVKCWGRNNYGQLGLGDLINRKTDAQMGDNLPFVSLGTNRTATDISAGMYHTCALLDNNTVKCWGLAANGQLGYGNTTNQGTTGSQMGDALGSVDLGTGRTAVQIVVGSYHSCAILDNASLKCWGYNANGQLGVGSTTQYGSAANQMGTNLPTISLGTGRTATAIGAGDQTTCAVLDNGSLKCWGRNNVGQLGQGSTATIGSAANQMGDNLAAINLNTAATVSRITVGGNHTCAVMSDGALRCFGYGANGRLGSGGTGNIGTTAAQMSGLAAVVLPTGKTAVSVMANDRTTCAILSDQTLRCFGYNGYGTVGIGTVTDWGTTSTQMGDNLGVTYSVVTGRPGQRRVAGLIK